MVNQNLKKNWWQLTVLIQIFYTISSQWGEIYLLHSKYSLLLVYQLDKINAIIIMIVVFKH